MMEIITDALKLALFVIILQPRGRIRPYFTAASDSQHHGSRRRVERLEDVLREMRRIDVPKRHLREDLQSDRAAL